MYAVCDIGVVGVGELLLTTYLYNARFCCWTLCSGWYTRFLLVLTCPLVVVVGRSSEEFTSGSVETELASIGCTTAKTSYI